MIRDVAAKRYAEAAYLLAREVEDLRDRLRQAWGLLRREDAESSAKASASQAR